MGLHSSMPAGLCAPKRGAACASFTRGSEVLYPWNLTMPRLQTRDVMWKNLIALPKKNPRNVTCSMFIVENSHTAGTHPCDVQPIKKKVENVAEVMIPVISILTRLAVIWIFFQTVWRKKSVS